MSEEKVTRFNTASAVWLATLETVLASGLHAAPRGKPTVELRQNTAVIDMAHPLVRCPLRKLSVRFACAEALWILDGDNRVEPLAKYAPAMREFSDDGVTLAGAYGPRIVEQLNYVIATLQKDRDTRQAVLTIWKPCPAPSKDIPCTVAMAFAIREEQLNCHVFMRSSDIWLGMPYDTFSFSMVATYIACLYNMGLHAGAAPVRLGALYLTAASAHLYALNYDGAEACIADDVAPPGDAVPEDLILAGNWTAIRERLEATRDVGETLRTLWEPTR